MLMMLFSICQLSCDLQECLHTDWKIQPAYQNLAPAIFELRLTAGEIDSLYKKKLKVATAAQCI